MLRCLQISTLFLGLSALIFAAAVGDGAATPAIKASFINAYNRGLFSLYVNDPSAIRALGTPGLVQEFPSKANTNLKYALVKPDPNAPVAQFDTLQVNSDIYSFYTSVGVGTAGYPTADTSVCPASEVGICSYQFFAKNYALFVFSSPTTANLAVRDPFYTVWQAASGVSGPLGVVANAETAVTSVSKVAGTQQIFAGGAIFSYPTGSATPTTYGVSGSIYSAWASNGGASFLGFPTSEAIQTQPNQPLTGLIRQTFEAGRIELTPGNTPVVLLPVAIVDITFAAQGLSLLPGATTTINATTLDTRGNTVLGRAMTWSSTNGAVVRVTGSGNSATVEAIGTGTANITVTVEGKTSSPISVRVGGACCLIGEGAPTQTATQAFQAALDRNQLTAALPVAAPVTRAGGGYIQTVTAAGISYVISIADGSGTAYLNSGSLYAAYLANGGFSGALGYPSSDPSGGAQRYASGAALAGNPVRLVPSLIAARWLTAGGPTGTFGQPSAAAVSFQSILGTTGTSQNFSSGTIYAVGARTFISSGLILARYLTLGGTSGGLGAPTTDLVNGRQDFETGYIDLQPGAAAAVEHFNARRPNVSLTPAVVVPGGRVHVSTTGFAPGATLNFTITGQSNFSVRAAAGAYEWDIAIPASAKPGAVSVQVTVPGSTETASGIYTISSAAALLPRLTVVSGDQQTGAPGSTLSTPIIVAVVDSAGAPIASVPVTWTLSPGASVSGSASTDSNGRAVGYIRLPLAAGVLVGAVSAAGQVVTISALISARSVSAFPSFQQAAPGGALVASLASLLRYQQTQGSLTTVRGVATVASLDSYLTSNQGYATSDSGFSVPNPWIAASFGGGGINLESPDLNTIRDLVGAGTPVVVLLTLRANGVAAGSTAVVATGIRADGSIQIADPDPALAATSLNDYLAGFQSTGRQVTGTLSAVIRITPNSPGPDALTVATPLSATASMGAVTGACPALDIPAPAGNGGVRFHYCDPLAGKPANLPDQTNAEYELGLAASKGAAILNLSSLLPVSVPANATVAWRVTSLAGVIAVVPQSLALTSVNDAAGFGTFIAPGSIISLFGTGLAAGGRTPSISISGRTLQVLFSTPFQVNAVIPSDLAAGSATVQVNGALGTVSQVVQVIAAAPAVFSIGQVDQKPLAAVINQDGTVNGPSNPAQRGQFVSIYATGLGATVLRNGLQATVSPVTLSINGGTPLPASYAGAVAGFVGLYQVNVQLPASTPPSQVTTMSLSQGGRLSNSTVLSVQ